MTNQPLQVGDPVVVKSLKKRGHISECLRGDTYRVHVGSLSIVVARSDLEAATTSPSSALKTVTYPTRPKSARVPTTIDLHGLTVEDAVRELESWLNECIIAGHGTVKVVHGLGTGRVQRAAHETLQRYAAVRAFRLNDLNPGETDVYIG
jgi:DNA mismatch repair protein MutS2